jgi:hypothetical protein
MDLALIKSAAPLPDIVREYLPLRKQGKDLVGMCPFHKEYTPSFTVHRDYFKCFGCGQSGDIFTFIQHMQRVDFPTAVRQLAARAGIDPDRPDPSYRRRRCGAEILARDAVWWQAGALLLLGQIAALTAEDEVPGPSHAWLGRVRKARPDQLIAMYRRSLERDPAMARLLVRRGREDEEDALQVTHGLVGMLAEAAQ